jgi:APA family basic amino acid/polyamine antiporter
VAALAAVGPVALAASSAPLATAVRAGDLDALLPAVRIGGTVAALGVLLSLLVGVSRTAFAMADDRELPHWIAGVHPVHRVPQRAQVVVGVIVAALVAVTDLRHAIGFSSFCVLTYYAIANASAWTLPAEQRRWPRSVAAAGLVGCVTLAFTLPRASVVSGLAVLGLGAVVWFVRHRGRRAGLSRT